MYIARSLKNDKKKCDTHVYVSFFRKGSPERELDSTISLEMTDLLDDILVYYKESGAIWLLVLHTITKQTI